MSTGSKEMKKGEKSSQKGVGEGVGSELRGNFPLKVDFFYLTSHLSGSNFSLRTTLKFVEKEYRWFTYCM